MPHHAGPSDAVGATVSDVVLAHGTAARERPAQSPVRHAAGGGADPVEPDEASTGALRRLREEGKLRFIGSSVYGMEAALAAIASARRPGVAEVRCLESSGGDSIYSPRTPRV